MDYTKEEFERIYKCALNIVGELENDYSKCEQMLKETESLKNIYVNKYNSLGKDLSALLEKHM